MQQKILSQNQKYPAKKVHKMRNIKTHLLNAHFILHKEAYNVEDLIRLLKRMYKSYCQSVYLSLHGKKN